MDDTEFRRLHAFTNGHTQLSQTHTCAHAYIHTHTHTYTHAPTQAQAIHEAVAPLVRNLSAAAVNRIVDEALRHSRLGLGSERKRTFDDLGLCAWDEDASHTDTASPGNAKGDTGGAKDTEQQPIPPRYSDAQLRSHNRRPEKQEDDSLAETRVHHRRVCPGL